MVAFGFRRKLFVRGSPRGASTLPSKTGNVGRKAHTPRTGWSESSFSYPKPRAHDLLGVDFHVVPQTPSCRPLQSNDHSPQKTLNPSPFSIPLYRRNRHMNGKHALVSNRTRSCRILRSSWNTLLLCNPKSLFVTLDNVCLEIMESFIGPIPRELLYPGNCYRQSSESPFSQTGEFEFSFS